MTVTLILFGPPCMKRQNPLKKGQKFISVFHDFNGKVKDQIKHIYLHKSVLFPSWASVIHDVIYCRTEDEKR